ncbi:putative transcription factor bHLH [Tripterygium wilfordii]|uniref:Putative transcription factor bHLH n=1 Tax=Tripterygium wilfordii TaxID=458696 RepID=A0A7J7DQ66_TRIWF|nr:putative transcription factor bHLH041 [Tripterygium wilfordii]KAF5748471.1 putative transcription factor bHLH [Tripterygium wilfordii]
MDAVFLLNEEDRENFLRRLMQSLRCTYIGLWWSYTHLPYPNNFLMSSGGVYVEEHNQASSSSGSTARSLFDEYRQLPFFLENEHVPGLAFKNNIPYIELDQQNLLRMASSETQLRFYHEAQIKFAVFMGCRNGEIEIGFSNLPNANIEMEIKNLFSEDFPGQSPARELLPQQPLVDPNRPSSSFGSQSMDSPDTSSLLLITTSTFPTTSHMPLIPPITTTPSSQQEAIQALARIRSAQLPTLESEEAAMTRAYLAVLTAPSSSSSSQQTQQNINVPVRRRATAFGNYLSPVVSSSAMSTTAQMRANMFKRVTTYYRRFNLARQEQMLQSRTPTGSSTQLHHMISERRRREKLNESFQALKALLPPETRKDKASVLIRTREYLSSLKTQIAELSRRNQLLEAQLSPSKKANTNQEAAITTSTGASNEESNEKLDVRITHVPESTSQEERIVDLRVTLRGECPVADVVFRILEFLRQVRNVNVTSMEADTRLVETTPFNHVVLRLNIEEGSEWDESAFQEAVKRVVADLAR